LTDFARNELVFTVTGCCAALAKSRYLQTIKRHQRQLQLYWMLWRFAMYRCFHRRESGNEDTRYEDSVRLLCHIAQAKHRYDTIR